MGELPPDWFLKVRLKLRHLQLFLALDDHRNLHRAADTLGMSQPAASKLLNELEERLGMQLFERHSRGIEPNWYGEIAVRHAHDILSSLQQTGEELNALNDGNAGVVSVGTVMAPAVTLIAQTLERVHRRLPGLKVNVHVDVSPALIPRLLEGEFDMVVSRIPAGFDPGHFVFEEIGEEAICIVCRRNHPLADKGSPTLAEMTAYPWSLQPPGALMRQRVDHLFMYHDLSPPARIVNTPDMLASLAQVAVSDTLTVVSREVAELLCDPQRFHLLPTEESLSVQPYGLVTLRKQRLSPGAAALSTVLREVIEDSRSTE
ncbi:LysR substrate-binding domain-containing protein [Aidingimonas halophila]|uniref:Transcriptional regulator, LysR family n=1 Tax=Aidingimonas halophila TaxID=574349 RepID=A0A1H3E496_9GAMM|nr:LysR family transcriptional regulator [Aidingimonas halophila]SDX73496.1 transcriptional regulator, LysR family [Aidingimonas halophila]